MEVLNDEVETAVAVPLPDVAVDVVVGEGKERVGWAEATLQNCCESCSAEDSREGHVVDMQLTIPLGNLPLKYD